MPFTPEKCQTSLVHVVPLYWLGSWPSASSVAHRSRSFKGKTDARRFALMTDARP